MWRCVDIREISACMQGIIVLPLVPNFYMHVFYERIVYIIVHALHVECLLTCTYMIHLDINKHVLSFHVHHVPMKPAVKSRATRPNACKHTHVFLRYKWSVYPRYNIRNCAYIRNAVLRDVHSTPLQIFCAQRNI